MTGLWASDHRYRTPILFVSLLIHSQRITQFELRFMALVPVMAYHTLLGSKFPLAGRRPFKAFLWRKEDGSLAKKKPLAMIRSRRRSERKDLKCAAFSTTTGNDHLMTDDEEECDSLSPSEELRGLVKLQLALLVAALEPRLRTQNSSTAIRCAVYCRRPSSMSAGSLKLQLVGASDGREAEAARQRTDLILGIPSADGQAQESWLVDQQVIVLPDSGGLVLPLAHNGFLVGLLVVERSAVSERTVREDYQTMDGLKNSASQNLYKVVPSALQPSACTIFQPDDVNLLKQAASALALACTMDLRSSLEAAGNRIQGDVVQGIVSEVKKPLGTIRTLGAMLAPRLKEGEPERDISEAIMVQGERLGQLVRQLQSALSPPRALNKYTIPPKDAEIGSDLEMGDQIFGIASDRGDAYDGSSTAPQRVDNGRQHADSRTAATTRIPMSSIDFQYPALPSSTIGGDTSCSWPVFGRDDDPATGSSFAAFSSGESENETQSPRISEIPLRDHFDFQYSKSENVVMGSGSENVAASDGTVDPDASYRSFPIDIEATGNVPRTSLRGSIDPLLNALSKFAAVVGVMVIPVDNDGNVLSDYQIPDADVAVEPLVLKRLFGQLLDGIVGSSSQGDCIEISFERHEYQQFEGILTTVRLLQAWTNQDAQNPSRRKLSQGAAVLDLNQLRGLANSAGGWFDMETSEDSPHRELSTFFACCTAVLWLPSADVTI